MLLVGAGDARAQATAAPTNVPPAPPSRIDFLQYGAALTAETRLAAGAVCPANEQVPCIVGSGGGLSLRAGYRTADGWMAAGAYEFSKQSSANLLKLGILQQLRFELRRYLTTGQRLGPYVVGGLGAAGYGSEWTVDTVGPLATFGVGLEYEISHGVFVGLAPSYRVVRLNGWRDQAGQDRPSGFVQFLGLEFTLEARTALPRY